MTQDIIDRIQKIEDVEAIRRLKYLYCYYNDEERIDDLMTLFASDSRVDLGLGRTASNKKDIETLFRKTYSIITFGSHMVHNPIIDVEGDAATGIWYVLVPSTRTGVAVWVHARYDEEYVRENGEWKIQSETITMKFVTPYDKGWVKERILVGLEDKYAAMSGTPSL